LSLDKIGVRFIRMLEELSSKYIQFFRARMSLFKVCSHLLLRPVVTWFAAVLWAMTFATFADEPTQTPPSAIDGATAAAQAAAEDAHPVNFQLMREDVARIRNAALEPKPVVAQETKTQPSPAPAPTPQLTPTPPAPIIAAAPPPSHGQDEAANVRQRWLLGGLMLVLLLIAAKYLHSKKQSDANKTATE
jgi:hypothetical protein